MNNKLPILSNEGGLSAYLDQIKKFPMLDAEEEYMLAKNWRTNDVSLLHPLNISIDCGNGAAGVVAERVYKSLGCQVEGLFCDLDGKFPNHHPDPSRPENVIDLIQSVKENNSDVGLALKLMFMYMILLLVKMLLKKIIVK